MIGQSNYFGFDFTTLDWKLLYLKCNVPYKIVLSTMGMVSDGVVDEDNDDDDDDRRLQNSPFFFFSLRWSVKLTGTVLYRKRKSLEQSKK